MRKFEIRGFDFCKEVEGLPITIQGYEFMPLFIYQADGSYGLRTLEKTEYSPSEIKGKYLISEEKTGFWCSVVADDPEQAYLEMKTKLDEIDYSPMKYKKALQYATTML